MSTYTVTICRETLHEYQVPAGRWSEAVNAALDEHDQKYSDDDKSRRYVERTDRDAEEKT